MGTDEVSWVKISIYYENS